jgi:peptidoglycan/LPS O-acetylase OafA/YrhL
VSQPASRFRGDIEGLRGVAVLLVVFGHVTGWPRGGFIGVDVFFVLSGFLITGILLGCRERLEASETGRRFYVGRFYARRFLRIFPVYYALLVALFIVDFERVRELAPWLFTYTTNLKIAFDGEWIGNIGHLWTLAVEEQFYLLWPWLILFLPRRWLVPALLAIIASGPISRAILSAIDLDGVRVGLFPRGTFTFAAWDSLGIGALTAVLARSSSASSDLLARLRRRLPAIVGLALVGLAIDYYVLPIVAWSVIGDVPMAAIFAWLVLAADRGFGGLGGRVLGWWPLVAVGTISYGVYLFHPFVTVLLERVGRRVGLDLAPPGFVPFLATLAVTILVAAISWRLFEKPINDLKRLVPYDRSDRDRPERRPVTEDAGTTAG